MRFVDWTEVKKVFEGKSVAIVGSAPSCLDNKIGFVDSHDVVVRVNNYRLSKGTGNRTDVFYSFFGSSVKKTPEELKKDEVFLCMCKCPNSKPIESEWHVKNGKPLGVDFRYIYDIRRDWWFCDTHVPDTGRFIGTFELLDRHIPTTGFSAIVDILDCSPGSVFITGFDFFASGIHNVNEPWRPGRKDDPIGHRPDLELGFLKKNKHLFTSDKTLDVLLQR